jgi:HK97 family phage major capsid protein
MAVIDNTLIPVTIAQEIIQAASEQSVVLQLARRQPMPTAQVNVPFLKTLPVSGWVNGVGGLKPEATVEWSADVLTTEEVAALVAVPQAWIDDSGIPIWPNVQEAITDSLAYSLDSAILFGTNAPPSFPAGGIVGQGMSATAAWTARTVHTATTDPPDLAQAATAAEGDVEDAGIISTGFAADISVKSQLRKLRDTVGQPVFVPNLGQDMYPTLWGDPLHFSASAAFNTNLVDIIAGNWNMLIVGVRQDITVDTSTEGVVSDSTGKVIVNAFQQDQVLMRVYMRVGYVIGTPVTRYGAGKPVFPFGFAQGTPNVSGAAVAEGDAEPSDEAPSGGNGGSVAKARK